VKEKSTESVAASSPTWETLEAFARQSMQQLLQRMLEDEVDGVLGRGRTSGVTPSIRTPAIATASADPGG